ncbi:MAG TPA: DUF488 domain-containing protein [Nevskiaceae bacterium]|nr:DUF488 domain-containing protein [Nevskiaceae bacterium]
MATGLHTINIKRAYDAPSPGDGLRVLIDRLWPRGVTKDAAKIDEWVKTLAPSTELRKWFGHDPAKFSEFRERYTQELDARKQAVQEVIDLCNKQAVTLVFSARDAVHNNAVVLKEYLERLGGH